MAGETQHESATAEQTPVLTILRTRAYPAQATFVFPVSFRGTSNASDVGIRISKGDYGLPRIIPSIESYLGLRKDERSLWGEEKPRHR